MDEQEHEATCPHNHAEESNLAILIEHTSNGPNPQILLNFDEYNDERFVEDISTLMIYLGSEAMLDDIKAQIKFFLKSVKHKKLWRKIDSKIREKAIAKMGEHKILPAITPLDVFRRR